MRITGSQVGPVTPAQLAKLKKAEQDTSTDAPRNADQVVLSRDASAVEAAHTAIAGMPDIREAKVETLRQQIQNGTYQVPAEKVADHILAEAQLSKLNR